MCGVAALVAHAGDENASVEAAYERLHQGLKQELDILSAISDTTTAQAAVEPLQNTLALLAERVVGVSDKDLWYYIENTGELKLPLVEFVQLLSVEFTRLEQARFFGCDDLREALLPQLRPNPDKMRD